MGDAIRVDSFNLSRVRHRVVQHSETLHFTGISHSQLCGTFGIHLVHTIRF